MKAVIFAILASTCSCTHAYILSESVWVGPIRTHEVMGQFSTQTECETRKHGLVMEDLRERIRNGRGSIIAGRTLRFCERE